VSIGRSPIGRTAIGLPAVVAASSGSATAPVAPLSVTFTLGAVAPIGAAVAPVAAFTATLALAGGTPTGAAQAPVAGLAASLALAAATPTGAAVAPVAALALSASLGAVTPSGAAVAPVASFSVTMSMASAGFATPTTLYLRSTTAAGIGTFFDALPTAGTAASTGIVNTTAGGTDIPWTRTAGGTALEWISGRSPAGGWTMAGAFTASIYAMESNVAANVGLRLRLYRRSAAGVETELPGSPWDHGTEFTALKTLYSITATPSSAVSFAEDDRLVIRCAIVPAGGTMGSGRTATLTYDDNAVRSGDSRIALAESVAFKGEAVSAPVAAFSLALALAASATPTGGAVAPVAPLVLAAAMVPAGVPSGAAVAPVAPLVLGASLAPASGAATAPVAGFSFSVTLAPVLATGAAVAPVAPLVVGLSMRAGTRLHLTLGGQVGGVLRTLTYRGTAFGV
jgi:hypothetical protein